MPSPKERVKKLLIIDDDQDTREVLRHVFSGPDFALTFASTGARGLAKAAELIPDLILLDVLMPGMDGFAVCRRLRTHPTLADVPVILITAGDARSGLQGLATADGAAARREVETYQEAIAPGPK
jgi:CheY-like chemotaxis protein